MPRQRRLQFDRDIRRARDLIGMGSALGGMTHGLVDASDVYRAALVQAVGALDTYVRGVVLDSAVQMIVNGQPAFGRHRKLGVALNAGQELAHAATPPERELIARRYVAEQLGDMTFQAADDIGAAFALIGVRKVWSEAFLDAQAAKTALGVVVTRRHQIVHNCDNDFTTTGSVVALLESDALSAVTILESTGHAIDAVC